MASSAQLDAQAKRSTTRLLQLRHFRLTRTIERFQDKLAIVNAELIARGVGLPNHAVHARRIIPGLRHGEISGLCIAILREAGRPLKLREIVTAVAARKGYDCSDAAFIARVTKRTRGAMEKFNRQRVTRLTAPPTSKRVRWELTALDSRRAGLP